LFISNSSGREKPRFLPGTGAFYWPHPNICLKVQTCILLSSGVNPNQERGDDVKPAGGNLERSGGANLRSGGDGSGRDRPARDLRLLRTFRVERYIQRQSENHYDNKSPIRDALAQLFKS